MIFFLKILRTHFLDIIFYVVSQITVLLSVVVSLGLILYGMIVVIESKIQVRFQSCCIKNKGGLMFLFLFARLNVPLPSLVFDR